MKEKRTWSSYKKAVNNIAAEVKLIMLIGHWNIKISFMKEESDNTAGCMIVLPKYFDATMRLYPPHYGLYKDGDDYEFVKTIIHELAHIITEPLYLEAINGVTNSSQEFLETMREQTTEQIANIVYNLWKK